MLELVGVGGMGRVYRAEQKVLGRTVAVKVIHPHLVHDESASARFNTEARAASALNHPNSVSIIDFGKMDDGLLYLVMEFLRGKDLAHVAYEEGPLPLRRIVNVLKQVLAGLAEAHHLGIIHRDLKPENIVLERMRSGSDFVKVVDFGLAKVRAQSSSITSPGIVCGTPDYMAPEQGRGDEIDGRSDLYAIGVILFRLLTGRLPFEGESATQVVLKHITLPPPDPRKLAPERNIPEAMVRVVQRALAKQAKDRFPDADAFAQALEASLQGCEESVGAVPSKDAPVNVCPSCEAIAPRKQKFCGECGRRMPGPPPATQVKRHSPTEDISAVRPQLPLPLTAREHDLSWLDARRGALRSSPIVGYIVGESGIGKTRLLREFLRLRAEAGDFIVEVGPDPYWADVGYWTLREAVRALGDLPPNGGREIDWIGASQEARRGLIEIFDRSAPLGSTISAEERRYTAAEALRWAMARAAAKGSNGVIFAIEDLDLIDGASRNAITDALLEPPLVPILVLATCAPRNQLELESLPQDSILQLSGLTSAASMQLARGLPVGPDPSDASPGAVVPLYVEQLIRLHAEGGGDAPPRLADLIAMRIERLAPFARRLLQALSVMGNDVEADTLHSLVTDAGTASKAGGSLERDIEEAIEQLVAAGMIEITRRGLRHAHPLIRELAGAAIPATVRRKMHAEAARIAQREELPIEVRALHQLHAGDAFEALCSLEQVAERALGRADTRGAIQQLRHGLELARREMARGELDDPLRAMLIFSRKLGEALLQAGSLSGAHGVLVEALDIAGPFSQDRAELLKALAAVARGRERAGEAFRYLEEAIEHASRSGAHELVTSLENTRREWMT